MNYENIIYEKEDGFAIITLNRPNRKNALNLKLMEELLNALGEIEEDGEVKTVIITGAGDAFAAGADIAMFDALTSPIKAWELSQGRNPVHEIERSNKPYIAAVNGLALGGGCELALACDLRIASDKAIFGQPEVNLGLLPGAGGTQRLPRLIGVTKAKEMLFTGDPIDAKEAFRIGLVNRVVDGKSLMDEAKKIAKKIASKPPIALKVIKSVVNRGLNTDIESALKYEVDGFAILFSTRDREEGIKAFLEKRRPQFRGK
jgi:enoyl-CoA hydratase